MPRPNEDEIHNLVNGSPALTTSEIGSRLGLSRNTAIKYLAIMETKGIIYHKTAGPSKIWFSYETRETRLKKLANQAYDALVSLEHVTIELSSKDERFPLDVDEIEKMKRKVEKYKLKY